MATGAVLTEDLEPPQNGAVPVNGSNGASSHNGEHANGHLVPASAIATTSDQLDLLREQTSELERRLEERVRESFLLDSEVRYLQLDLEVKSEFVRSLEAELDARVGRLGIVESELATHSGIVDSLRTELAECARERTSLAEALTLATGNQARLESELAAQRARSSSVAVDKMASWLHERPRLHRTVWAVARSVRAGGGPDQP